MIVKINQHQLSAELSQVMLKLLDDDTKLFPEGLLMKNSLTLTSSAEEKYNEVYEIINEIIDDIKIKK